MPKLKLLRNPVPSDPAAGELRRRLDDFYTNTQTYTAFDPSHDSGAAQQNWHDLILPTIRSMLGSANAVRVLELGAGRPSFPAHLGEMRSRVIYHAQDVTPANQDYLKQVADDVFICDPGQIIGRYDIIFSTFVLEHVATPSTFLEQVDRLLNPGGAHFVFCPRYDMPGYVCPSLRHLSRLARWQAMTFLMLSRVMSRLNGQPRFWVNADPAVFHAPWFRDADAVHLVSRFDVEQWHRRRGYETRRLFPPVHGIREWILTRKLTTAVRCTKPAKQGL
ncbi:MAG TPA: class I SAM-dependent methyltransferase [Tepidisphaeraceae bacterium]|nr:class I SAM-dependent methyltransferase [Tepidisphaeraceae bacterium]